MIHSPGQRCIAWETSAKARLFSPLGLKGGLIWPDAQSYSLFGFPQGTCPSSWASWCLNNSGMSEGGSNPTRLGFEHGEFIDLRRDQLRVQCLLCAGFHPMQMLHCYLLVLQQRIAGEQDGKVVRIVAIPGYF